MTGILESLSLQFGPTPDSDPITIHPGAMTVLVGPNNAGKSLLLREIQHFVGHAPSRPRSPRPYFGLLGGARNESAGPSVKDEYRLLQHLQPRLPATEDLRLQFLEAVSSEVTSLGLAQEPQGVRSEAQLEQIGLLFGNDEARSKQVARRLTRANLADEWRKEFRRVVRGGRIDPNAFLRLMDISEDSPLARILLLDQSEGWTALQHVVGDDEKQQDQLIDHGLEMAQRFQRYLGDHASCIDLVAQGVVDLSNHRQVLAPHTILLDGHSRLRQVEPEALSDFYDRPKNIQSYLLRDTQALESLREYVYKAFGFYLAIDILDMKNARFVAADEPPEGREFTLGPDAVAYFQDTTDLREMSDGVRSFVGIHAALAGSDDRLILIDEPEAFLHPPLVRRLGFDLTRMAAARGASIIAATHSAHFLMGCIEAGEQVDVIRLGYENKIPTARALPNDQLTTMMRDPLLRSTNVLSALFHRTAVVCEGDTDGAFYGEINERLRVRAENTAQRGAPAEPWIRDGVFINAHSKQSVPRLMGALRRMGIPAAAVVDLDLLIDDEVVPDLLKQAGVGEAVYSSIGQMRSRLLKIYEQLAEKEVPPLGEDASAEDKRKRDERFKSRRGKLIKRKGIANLSGTQDRQALRHFIEDLARYGIFVPACGDLESWLPEVSQGLGKGKNWLPTMFERMGTLGQENYLEPGDDDVWKFVRAIARWIDRSLTTYDWIPTP